MSDNPFADAVEQARSGPQPPPLAAPPPLPTASSSASNNPFADAVETARNAPPEDQKPPQAPAPSWSEVPGQALSNIPHSGAEFVGNLATAAMHPIQTAQNLGSIGLGVMEKVGKHIGLPAGQGY